MRDEELVHEFRKGNREAFSELVTRHSKPLTMMLLRLVRDEDTARDISQSALLKAFESLPRFMMASSFKTWLYSIAINAAKDLLRKRKPQAGADAYERLIDPTRPPGERIDKARNVQRLRKAIEGLPEKQRLTLQLRIYEEMDYKEIARVLGGTAGGARGNFFQAIKTLKGRIGDES
jgi:RNA polymerase sigma-70 factor, ECF subfamily